MSDQDISEQIQSVPLWLEELDQIIVQGDSLVAAKVLHVSSAEVREILPLLWLTLVTL